MWVWLKRFSFLGVFCFFSLGFSSSVYASDETTDPVTVYEYRGQIYYDLEETKEVIKRYIEQETGIYPKLKSVDPRLPKRLSFQPFTDPNVMDPPVVVTPYSTANDYATSASEVLSRWEEASTKFSDRHCPKSYLDNIQGPPLEFNYWLGVSGYWGQGVGVLAKYYSSEYTATLRTFKNGNCTELPSNVSLLIQRFDAYKCPAVAVRSVLYNGENTLPECYLDSVQSIKFFTGCPTSHPVPKKDPATGQLKTCAKQNICLANQPKGQTKGNPIACSSGEKMQADLIYQGVGADAFSFTTLYNSPVYDEASDSLISQFDSAQGKQRADNVTRSLSQIYDVDGLVIYRMSFRDGMSYLFSGSDTATTLTSNLPQSGSLKILANGNFEQVSPDGTRHLFNASGQYTQRIAPDGKTRSYTYGSNGKVSSVTNHFGQSLRYFYNGSGLLNKLTTPDNQDYLFNYDANDNLIQITYPDETPADLTDNPSLQFLFEDSRFPNHLTGKINEKGIRYASWSYDDKGRAISSEHGQNLEKVELDYSVPGQTRVKTYVSNTLSNEAIYHYSSTLLRNIEPRKYLTELEQLACADCEVGTWQYQYDGSGTGYLHQETSPSGKKTKYYYDTTTGLVNRRIEGYGTPEAKTIYTYYSNRDVSAIYQAPYRITYGRNNTTRLLNSITETDNTNQETRTTSYTYNSDGLVSSINGPRTDVNDITTLAYDNLGNLISSTNALGQVTTFDNYDANGRVGRITDANGIESLFTYTPRGWLKTSSINGATTAYEYFPTGSIQSVTNPFGQVINYEYDDGERLIAVEDNQGNRMEYTRDLMGNVTETKVKDSGDVLKRSQQAVFNALGQLKQSLGNNGQSTELTYDAEGNPTSDNNALNHSTTSSFDALNRLTETLDANNGSTAYTYDSFDRVTSVTDAEGKVTSYQYNAFGDLTELSSPDTGTTTFTYDSAGNVLTKTDARGITVTYTYDALNRVLTESYPNSNENKTFSYDDTTRGNKGIGRLTRVTDQSGVTIYRYNPFGQVTQQTQRIGSNRYILRYHYNAKGRMTGMTYPSGQRVLFNYNALGQVSRVRLRQGSQVSNLARNIRYLPFGPIKSLVYGNGKILRQSYDLDYRLTRKSVTGIHGLNYQYDLTDNVTQIQNGTDAESFVYDVQSRLTQGQGSYGTLDYSYDKIGNRLSKTDNGNTDNYLYGSTGHWLTSITGSNPFDFTHDAAGNTLSQGNLLFSYNQQGRLQSAIQSGMSANYLYNAQGQRVQKQVNGTITQYIYNLNGQLIAEADSNGTITKEYSYIQGQPFAQIQNNQIYYYHNDHLGTPKVITDQNQQIVWQATHTPFGKASITTSTIENNIRFAGQYYDAETNLHYNYFRYYSPETGRYITSDPIGLNGGINTYGYVGGNPVNYLDPLGLEAMDWLWGSIHWATGGWEPDQSTVDFGAGLGDTLTFGLTRRAREAFDIGSVNSCSKAYGYGELAGIVGSVATGFIGGTRAVALNSSKFNGLADFSHSLFPNGFLKKFNNSFARWLNKKGNRLNGDYVPRPLHWRMDKVYRTKFLSESFRKLFPSFGNLRNLLNRMPYVPGSAIYGASSAAFNSNCECNN